MKPTLGISLDGATDSAGEQLLEQLDKAVLQSNLGRSRVHEWLRSGDLAEPLEILSSADDWDGANVIARHAHPLAPDDALEQALELSRLRGDHLTVLPGAGGSTAPGRPAPSLPLSWHIAPVNPRRLKRFLSLPRTRRVVLAERFAINRAEMMEWAARHPSEVPRVNGEFFFIALFCVDCDD